MCKITYYVWNKIIQGSLSRSVWKKFLSLEKFYTHIVADVADYYEVCIYPLPSFVKHGLALQDDFGMQKILVNKHKQLVLGETPFLTPNLGFIPVFLMCS